MKRRLFILTASFLMTVLMLSHSDVLTVFADGCDNTQVDMNGATCSQSGSIPGTPGGSGESEEDGLPGDSGSNNNNNNNTGNDGVACTPGTIVEGSIYTPVDSEFLSTVVVEQVGESSESMCAIQTGAMDPCTGEFVGSVLYETVPAPATSGGEDGVAVVVTSCPTSWITPPNPCDEFTVSGGGVTCKYDWTTAGKSGASWELRAHAGWPGIEIHTRPFPVTLVDWDTVMRVAGLGSSSGSGHLAYAPWGGGRSGSPAAGDWRDVVLRLEIKPLTSWADVFLENVGLIRMPVGRLHTFQWNLPSHPAAGGGPLAGEVGQLEELEPDTPLYSNWTRAPYMVYCTIEYYQWESSCVGGPDDSGNTNCRRNSAGVFTGHREWAWKRHSQTVPIPPTAANVNLPANFLADLNGDGVPDAYWGHTTFVRRMDDAGNVDNPEWAHSYSWPGPYWYWAAREAQGQIGWPGVPVDQ
jgi:hypothetical protein